jgi:hypothetical protein
MAGGLRVVRYQMTFANLDLVTVSDIKTLDLTVLTETVGIAPEIGADPIAVVMPYAEFQKVLETFENCDRLMRKLEGDPEFQEAIRALASLAEKAQDAGVTDH